MYPKWSDVEPYLLTTIGDYVIAAYRQAARMRDHTAIHAQPDPLPEPPRAETQDFASPRHNKPKDTPPRAYASQYKGVSVNRGHWYGIWTEGSTHKCGPVRPYSAEGERWAAQDRARALGLDYLELRDGTRVAWRW